MSIELSTTTSQVWSSANRSVVFVTVPVEGKDNMVAYNIKQYGKGVTILIASDGTTSTPEPDSWVLSRREALGTLQANGMTEILPVTLESKVSQEDIEYTLLDYSGTYTPEQAADIMSDVGVRRVYVLEDVTHYLLEDGYVIIDDPAYNAREIYSTNLS